MTSVSEQTINMFNVWFIGSVWLINSSNETFEIAEILIAKYTYAEYVVQIYRKDWLLIAIFFMILNISVVLLC